MAFHSSPTQFLNQFALELMPISPIQYSIFRFVLRCKGHIFSICDRPLWATRRLAGRPLAGAGCSTGRPSVWSTKKHPQDVRKEIFNFRWPKLWPYWLQWTSMVAMVTTIMIMMTNDATDTNYLTFNDDEFNHDNDDRYVPRWWPNAPPFFGLNCSDTSGSLLKSSWCTFYFHFHPCGHRYTLHYTSWKAHLWRHAGAPVKIPAGTRSTIGQTLTKHLRVPVK